MVFGGLAGILVIAVPSHEGWYPCGNVELLQEKSDSDYAVFCVIACT